MGGSVVTWGNAAYGGDSTSVADKLAGEVVQICGNSHAFAAIKADGSVVTWGDAYAGGDSTSVADKLAGEVVQIRGNGYAFAAIKADGSVVTWGVPGYGGDFAVTWDFANDGGDSISVADKLAGEVVQI